MLFVQCESIKEKQRRERFRKLEQILKQVDKYKIAAFKSVDLHLFKLLFITYGSRNGRYAEYIESYKRGPNNATYITEESGVPLTRWEFNRLIEIYE